LVGNASTCICREWLPRPPQPRPLPLSSNFVPRTTGSHNGSARNNLKAGSSCCRPPPPPHTRQYVLVDMVWSLWVGSLTHGGCRSRWRHRKDESEARRFDSVMPSCHLIYANTSPTPSTRRCGTYLGCGNGTCDATRPHGWRRVGLPRAPRMAVRAARGDAEGGTRYPTSQTSSTTRSPQLGIVASELHAKAEWQGLDIQLRESELAVRGSRVAPQTPTRQLPSTTQT
jgi:hypothetical protein